MRKFFTKLTSRGTLCLFVSLVLMIAGIYRGDGAFISLGLATLMVIIFCYILGRCNLSRLEIEISIPHKCHANKYYKPHVVIRNKRSLIDAFHVELLLSFPHGATLAICSAWIPARSLSAADVSLKIPMRASCSEHPYQFTSIFPLGLFRFTSRQLLRQPLTIYPRCIVPDELLDHGVAGHCQNPDRYSSIKHFGEPGGIRPWQPGDPAKSIHWPASILSLARGNSLLVRELDPPGKLPEHTVVIFHSFSAKREMMREDAYERAIALAAGTIAHLRNLKIKTTFVADFMRWHPISTDTRTQYYECLTILAVSQRAVSTELHELQAALHKVSHTQQLIIISDMPTEAWHGLLQLPESATVIDIRQVHFPIQKTISAREALSRSA